MTENTIGPYREGVSINVTCMSSGGIPVSITHMQMKFQIILHFQVFYNTEFSVSSIPPLQPPRVSWWKEHALLDDSFEILPDGSVKNVLHIQKLQRKDLNNVSRIFLFFLFVCVCVTHCVNIHDRVSERDKSSHHHHHHVTS